MTGIRFDPATPLLGRALTVLEAEALPTEELARRIFDLRQAPPGLAARLVFDLLGQDRRVRVNEGGVWSLAADPVAASLPESPRLVELEFAVVDVETTGSRREDRIMEIACVHVAAGVVGARFSTLVDPGCGIPASIRRLTGIDKAMVEAAPRFEQVSDVVRRVLAGRVFVAHNVRFDWRFVSAELARARGGIPSGDQLCTVRFAKRALPGLRRWGLDSLIEYYGLECRARHRAWGDALVTAELLVRLLEVADRRGVETWEGLGLWLGRQPAGASKAKRAGGVHAAT